MLEKLFKQYPGYVQLRLFTDKRLAFIEFGSEEQAAVALRGLRDFKLSSEHTLNLDYSNT
jgi:hypothetical protein